MDKRQKNEVIHLSNRTAISLRRNARSQRSTWRIAAALFTAVMAVCAVLLGMRWLLSVPLIVLCTVALDAAMLTHAKSRYLSLLGQAICTEASARTMREQQCARERREQTVSDILNMQEDAQRALLREKEESTGSSLKEHREPVGMDVLGNTRRVPRVEMPERERDTQQTHRRRRQVNLTVIGGEQKKRG